MCEKTTQPSNSVRRARFFRLRSRFFATEQPSWSWDVSANGQQFLIIVAKDDPAPLTLVLNWAADLRK
jgi:hypothetical protein